MKRLNKSALAALIGLLFLLVAGTWKLSNARSFQLFGDLVHRVDTSEKVVALTFDDGPTPAFTREMLKVLKDKGVVATFYLNGKEAAVSGASVKAIYTDSHEIGNHSFNHKRLVFMASDDIKSEVERGELAIRSAGYTGPLTFRPPHGKKLVYLPYYLDSRGITTVMWDVEPEKSDEIGRDAGKMVRLVGEQVRPGSIVLMHLMYQARSPSRQALPGVIDELRKQGYRFVTVSELLKLRKPA
ncbi:MAG: polysaccharide deacetylase family protein [Pseudomonadota bacterium]